MRPGNIFWIIAASCMALISLVVFQVNWLQHSRRLIEEQFDQKVTMAMCSAVERMERSQNAPDLSVCSTGWNSPASSQCCNQALAEETDNLRTELTGSMQCYAIDKPFKFSVVNTCNSPNTANAAPTYYCPIPAVAGDDRFLALSFPTKQHYVFEKLGFMVGSSIFILLFISAVFLLTLRALVRQKQLNRISVDFFNNMAHEFRTPLTNIGLALGRLRKGSALNPDDRYLGIIQSERNRLLEQIERILHVAKLERGNYQLEKSPIDLQELTREVVADMNLQANGKHANIEWDADNQPLPVLYGDRLHLSNAIRNILDNAMKYCEQLPRIIVRAKNEGKYAQLSFEDNGVGISAMDQHRLFRPFQRGFENAVEGFGLGLTYVKKVVEMHGGYVKVDSCPTSGTCFHVFLPVENTREYV